MGEARQVVEAVLQPQDPLPHLPPEPRGEAGAKGGVHRLHHEGHLLVGDASPEDAKPQGVVGGGVHLGGVAGLEDLLHLHGPGLQPGRVAGRVVRPLGGDHHGDARGLHHPGVVGGDGLPLDDGNPFHAQGLPQPGRPLGQEAGLLAVLVKGAEPLLHEGVVPPVGQALLHEEGQAGPGLNGVYAQVVGQAVEAGQPIGVGEAAVGAEEADGLVLQGGDHLLPLLVHDHVGALDDAPGHAGVGVLAAPALVEGGDVLPAHAEGLRWRKPPLAEVAHGQAAEGVLEVGHAHGADGVVKPHDQGVLPEEPGVAADGLQHLGLIPDLRLPRHLHHDGLDPFQAHHRPHAAPGRQAGGAPVYVGEGDAGKKPKPLPYRPYKGEGDPLPVGGEELFGGGEVAKAEEVFSRVKEDLPRPGKAEDHPVLALALEDQPGQLHLPQGVAEGAPAVGLLDAQGEGAPGTHAGAVGVGKPRARQGPHGEDQGVLRGEGVKAVGLPLQQDPACAVPPPEGHLLRGHLLPKRLLRLQVKL